MTTAPDASGSPDDHRDNASRWALVRQLRANPAAQGSLWVALALWSAATLIGMFGVGRGNPLSLPSIVLLAADAVALGIMLLGWRSLNASIILVAHTVLAVLTVNAVYGIKALAAFSIAIMFGAAEAAQHWWASGSADDPTADRTTAFPTASRAWAAIEVVAIALGAAILVALLGQFESRLATVAAVLAFVALGAGAIVLRRRE